MTFGGASSCPTLRLMTHTLRTRSPRKSIAALAAVAGLSTAVGLSLAACSSAAPAPAPDTPVSDGVITNPDCHQLPGDPGEQLWDVDFSILNMSDQTRDFTVVWRATHDYSNTGLVKALPAHHEKTASIVLKVPVAPDGSVEPVPCDPSDVYVTASK